MSELPDSPEKMGDSARPWLFSGLKHGETLAGRMLGLGPIVQHSTMFHGEFGIFLSTTHDNARQKRSSRSRLDRRRGASGWDVVGFDGVEPIDVALAAPKHTGGSDSRVIFHGMYLYHLYPPAHSYTAVEKPHKWIIFGRKALVFHIYNSLQCHIEIVAGRVEPK